MKLATWNVLELHSNYLERPQLIIETLEELQTDTICLQESWFLRDGLGKISFVEKISMGGYPHVVGLLIKDERGFIWLASNPLTDPVFHDNSRLDYNMASYSSSNRAIFPTSMYRFENPQIGNHWPSDHLGILY